jgi:phosphoglycerate dehydrogenase-like enzyme
VTNRPQALLVMNSNTLEVQFRRPQLDRLRALAELGDPVWAHDLDDPRVSRRLGEVDVLITSWGCPQLTQQRLARAPRLRAVFHCAGTVREIVSDEVWRRGILVTNAADDNAIPVAEFTFAAVVFAGKKAPFLAQDARIHRADWSYVGRRGELSNRDRVVGVVGFSRIGRRVIERLRTLDVDVLVSDPYATPEDVAMSGGRLVEMDELLRTSDILTLHVPALPETRGLIGAAELALLRDGATVINTARGAVLDTAALERECSSGRLDAILDVTDPDPLPADSVLYDLPNVMITPHIAGSLGAETRRMSESALDELERFLGGRGPRSAVTPEDLVISA